MNVIAFVFCISALVTISKCSTEYEDKKRLTEIYWKCRAETQTEDGEIGFDFTKLIRPTTRKVKCMVTCLLRESGMITNGKFDKEGALKLNEKYHIHKKEDLEKARIVADICEKKMANEPGDCDLGTKMVACFRSETEKIGLT